MNIFSKNYKDRKLRFQNISDNTIDETNVADIVVTTDDDIETNEITNEVISEDKVEEVHQVTSRRGRKKNSGDTNV